MHPNHKPDYASINVPAIRELVNGHSTLMSLQDARGKLEYLRRRFRTVKALIASDDEVELWIQWLNITDEDKKNGYMGRFARFLIRPSHGDRFRIAAQIVEKPLKEHPLKLRDPRRYPNSGHPVFRDMLRSKVFRTRNDAIERLNLLQNEFPTVSIRIEEDILRIMSYSKSKDKKTPISRWQLYLEENEGGYIIKGHTQADGHVLTSEQVQRKLKHRGKTDKPGINNVAPSQRVNDPYVSPLLMTAFIFGDAYLKEMLDDSISN